MTLWNKIRRKSAHQLLPASSWVSSIFLWIRSEKMSFTLFNHYNLLMIALYQQETFGKLIFLSINLRIYLNGFWKRLLYTSFKAMLFDESSYYLIAHFTCIHIDKLYIQNCHSLSLSIDLTCLTSWLEMVETMWTYN